MRKQGKTNCNYCKKEFSKDDSEIKRNKIKNRPNYCSLSCSAKGSHPKKIKVNNCNCSYCSKEFFLRDYRKLVSKSGLNFCSRKCKDMAQRMESNFPEIRPYHYGTGIPNYREIAYKHKERKCEKCGYCKIPGILQVHHIDRNRLNNNISNLLILCPNCHQEEHFLNKDGIFTENKIRVASLPG